MFFFLSKLLDIFLGPLTWALILLAMAIPWRRRSQKRWRRRRAYAIAGFAILFVAANGSVSNALEWHVENDAVSTYRPDGVYDAVIVLGGMGDERVWKERDQPAWNDDVERVMVAYRLLSDGQARYAIVSGGPVDRALDPWSEAHQLRDQLVEWGIASERIFLEDQAKNTRENAVFSKEIATAHKFTRLVVVTSAFHIPRATQCFRAVGVDADYFPTDYRAAPPQFRWFELLPRSGALELTTAMTRELAGRVIYRVVGYGK